MSSCRATNANGEAVFLAAINEAEARGRRAGIEETTDVIRDAMDGHKEHSVEYIVMRETLKHILALLEKTK